MNVRKTQRVLMRISLVFAGLIFALYLGSAYLLPIPSLALIAAHDTTKVFDRHGELLYETLIGAEGKKTYTALDSLPQHVLEAFLAAEDKRFYKHAGVDVTSTLRALYQNISEGDVVSGGSTITQQLARNVLHPGEPRTYYRKFIEALYANRLEHAFTKQEILEKYLNTIYFGNLSYGIEAASKDYFNKSSADLDIAESALLAGIVQAPSRFNPFFHFDAAKKRQAYVLEQLREGSYITPDDFKDALEERLIFRVNTHQIKAPHFVFYTLQEAERILGRERVRRGGLSITTTLDYGVQRDAEIIMQKHIRSLEDKNVGNAALLVTEMNSHAVVVWAGSVNFFDSTIDGAVDMVTALRQPGSALKPFVYLAGLMHGFTLADVLPDIPTQYATDFGPYAPKNYDLTFHGPVSLRDALANSYNVPAVYVLNRVGVGPAIHFLRTLGITTLTDAPEKYGLSLTLGGGEVTLQELTGAYGVLARDGALRPLVVIRAVTDAIGETIYSSKQSPTLSSVAPFNAEHAFLIKNVMSDNAARIASFGEDSYLELDRPAAVKTGTTRNFKDNWTLGFTPQYVAGVWVGNADGSPMEQVSGVDGAAPIWHDTMLRLHKHVPRTPFTVPAAVTTASVCRTSGKRATPDCPVVKTEYFIPGTEPTTDDTTYQRIAIDRSTNTRWKEGCNPRHKETVLFQVYPVQYLSWAAEEGAVQPPSNYCDGSSVQHDHSHEVIITSPQPGDIFKRDPTVPSQFEQLTFSIAPLPGVTSVTWHINDETHVVDRHPFSYRWILQPGTHSLSATLHFSDGSERTATMQQFTVY